MSTRFPSRRIRLAPLAAAVLLVGPGCKSTPPLITDIGNAVDRGTQSIVGAFDGRSLPPPEDSEEEAVTRARNAYDAGKLAYQTAQYLEALDHFHESFAAADEIEDPELRAQVQSSLYYNLGSTHLRAYDLDGDRTHLAQAKVLLQSYLDSTPVPNEQERAEAVALMDEADAELADAEAKDAADGEADG